MTSVLLIGYGKIGAIKASKWQHLGFDVVVIDTHPDRLHQATQAGFAAVSSLSDLEPATVTEVVIVDISLPTHLHISTLQAVLPLLSACRVAFIEKPLFSAPEEIEDIKRIHQQHPDVQIIVNENYYASTGLQALRDYMARSQKQVQTVIITFTKNRLPDVQNGRFTDENLGPYGIEVPHMFACLKYLGFDKHEVVHNLWHTNVLGESGSEGVICTLKAHDVLIHFIEVLGPFKVLPSLEFVADHSAPIERSIQVTFADSTTATLEFDPVPGIERYYSRLTTPDNMQLIKDDHLYTMLSWVAGLAHEDATALPLIAPARYPTILAESQELLDLRRSATVKDSATLT